MANFNPLTPGGVRRTRDSARTYARNFNPLTPGGVRPDAACVDAAAPDFNPLTPGGVRLATRIWRCVEINISIHSPRVG